MTTVTIARRTFISWAVAVAAAASWKPRGAYSNAYANTY